MTERTWFETFRAEGGELVAKVSDAIREGNHPYGMVSFDQSLTNLVKRKLVAYEVALAASTNPADFELAFRGVTGGTSDTREVDDDVEFEIE